MKEPQPLSSIPEDVLNGLCQQWMGSFETAARAQQKHYVMNLFVENALICGFQKGGPLDAVMSKTFEFQKDQARIFVRAPFVLCVVPWIAKSPLALPSGVRQDHKGDATLFVGVENMGNGKQHFVCYHAHFSMIE